MSSETESIAKMSVSNIKRKIQQFKKSNSRLKQKIDEDTKMMTISEKKAEQKFKEAQEAKTAKEKVQQEINQKNQNALKNLQN